MDPPEVLLGQTTDQNLPTEIYLRIWDYLCSPDEDVSPKATRVSMCRFSLVCRLFRSIAFPVIFRTLTVDLARAQRRLDPGNKFCIALSRGNELAVSLALTVNECHIIDTQIDSDPVLRFSQSHIVAFPKLVCLHTLKLRVRLTIDIFDALCELKSLDTIEIMYHFFSGKTISNVPVIAALPSVRHAYILPSCNHNHHPCSLLEQGLYNLMVNSNLITFSTTSWDFARQFMLHSWGSSLQLEVLELGWISDAAILYSFLNKMPSLAVLRAHGPMNSDSQVPPLKPNSLPKLHTLACPLFILSSFKTASTIVHLSLVPCACTNTYTRDNSHLLSNSTECLSLWNASLESFEGHVDIFEMAVKNMQTRGGETFPRLKDLSLRNSHCDLRTNERFKSAPHRASEVRHLDSLLVLFLSLMPKMIISLLSTFPCLPSLDSLAVYARWEYQPFNLATQHRMIASLSPDKFPVISRVRWTEAVIWRHVKQWEWRPLVPYHQPKPTRNQGGKYRYIPEEDFEAFALKWLEESESGGTKHK